jgi:hypothetical protein
MDPEVRILSWKMLFFGNFVNCLPLRQTYIYIQQIRFQQTLALPLSDHVELRFLALFMVVSIIVTFRGTNLGSFSTCCFRASACGACGARVTSIHTLTPRPQLDPRSDDTIRHMIVMCALHEMTGYPW